MHRACTLLCGLVPYHSCIVAKSGRQSQPLDCIELANSQLVTIIARQMIIQPEPMTLQFSTESFQSFVSSALYAVLHILCFACGVLHTVLYILCFACSASHPVLCIPVLCILCFASMLCSTHRATASQRWCKASTQSHNQHQTAACCV